MLAVPRVRVQERVLRAPRRHPACRGLDDACLAGRPGLLCALALIRLADGGNLGHGCLVIFPGPFLCRIELADWPGEGQGTDRQESGEKGSRKGVAHGGSG